MSVMNENESLLDLAQKNSYSAKLVSVLMLQKRGKTDEQIQERLGFVLDEHKMRVRTGNLDFFWVNVPQIGVAGDYWRICDSKTSDYWSKIEYRKNLFSKLDLSPESILPQKMSDVLNNLSVLRDEEKNEILRVREIVLLRKKWLSDIGCM